MGELRKVWSEVFQSKAAGVPPVDEKGILRIDWTVSADDGLSVEVDLILATATKAAKKRTSPEEIADAWIGQGEGHERYFFENVRSGIRTPGDGTIWKRIEERAPWWLKNEAYGEAVGILREEAGNGCVSI